MRPGRGKGKKKKKRKNYSRGAPVPDDADPLPRKWYIVSPRSRVPRLATERLDAAQVLRHTRGPKAADGAEHDARHDGAPAFAFVLQGVRRSSRSDVLEHDRIRLHARVPRRAHDLGAKARVCAQAVLRPHGLAVRADVALPRVVRVPARVWRAREGVPVCRDVGSTAL
jgi:hypothetical protein